MYIDTHTLESKRLISLTPTSRCRVKSVSKNDIGLSENSASDKAHASRFRKLQFGST